MVKDVDMVQVAVAATAALMAQVQVDTTGLPDLAILNPAAALNTVDRYI